MLNRIYIIVGMLAIIVLAGAFIAPRFIQWSNYRDRMEILASGVLGADVIIRGDIEFSLLPQPRLRFSDVLVGSPDEPSATVAEVEAEFSLMDFLRDNYNVTRLVLNEPVIDFTIDDSGLFGSGVAINTGGNGGVALGQATIIDGTMRLADRRSGENYVADDVDGELTLASFAGPFQFQGNMVNRDERYGVRFNSSAVDAGGNARISGYLEPESNAFVLTVDGGLAGGMAPRFDGTLLYRQRPPVAEVAEGIQGDMVFESAMQASTDRIVLSGYTLQPDENRAGTRLTGAASIQLGTNHSFDAVISGGVLSLPPRDAAEDTASLPYELVRLLAELPPPPIPPLPGRVGIDLAEVGLRGFALRDVRLDARTDGASWVVEQFIGQLPGDSEVRVNGRLGSEDGRPAFTGQMSVVSPRVDALAALWRKPDENSVLFNVPAALDTMVILGGDALGLNGGTFTLDGVAHKLEMRAGFGAEKRLDIVGNFSDLSADDSAMVLQLLPEITSEPSFGVSFPTGSFSLTASTATLLGQDGVGLAAEGQWSASQITFNRLLATDFGGIGLDAALGIAGTLAEPVISGSGVLKVAQGDAPALVALYDLIGTPAGWRSALAPSLPGEIIFDAGAPNDDGGQVLTLGGTLGVAQIDFRGEMAGGLTDAFTSPLRLRGTLQSADAPGLTRQLGFGDADLFTGEGDMMVAMNFEGSPTNSLQSQLTASNGDEFLSFSGNLNGGNDGELQGTGVLEGNLADAGGLAELVGASGLSLPMAQGRAQIHFEGERLARLTEIAGTSGEVGFTGELSLSRTGPSSVVAGAIAIDRVDISALSGAILGPAALVAGDGVWPEGPIASGDSPRRTRGSIAVTVPEITVGGQPKLRDASFDLSWDETRIRLARLQAAIGAGTATFDISVCCAGPAAERTINGRLTLDGVALDDIAPAGVAGSLNGLIEAGGSFEGTGASIAEVMATMAGEGSFTVDAFVASQLNPGVFPALAELDDVLNMDGDALAAIIGLSLGQGDFTAPTLTGAFTMAGGVARMANLIVDGQGARLAGEANLQLNNLGLDGSFALTPAGFVDPGNLIAEDTASISTLVSGTLLAPIRTLDLATMVAAIQVRANELEVDRLEILRAEDAERQRAAAEERNRLIQEQRDRAAAEAARLAAEEAARLASEEARRLQEEQLQQQLQSPPPQPLPPATAPTGTFDLNLPPVQPNQTAPVNQPFLLPAN